MHEGVLEDESGKKPEWTKSMCPKTKGITTSNKCQRTEDFGTVWNLGVKGKTKPFLGM